MLKRLLLMAALGFALLIGSCKKELLTGDGPNSFEPIPSIKLTEVKQWYSRNEGLITSEFNWLNSLSPKWDSVRVQNNEKGSVYEAVLHNPDKIFATDGAVNLKDSRKKYAPKSSIRLLIFRDELGQSYRSCFMEIIATGESELPQQLSYKNYGNLNGLVSFYELDGKLANSWVYSNGKAVMSTSSNGTLKVGSSAKSKSGANGRIMFEDGPPEGYIDCGNRLVAHTREVCGEVGGLEGPGYDGGEGSGKICREEMYFVSERIYCPIPPGGPGNGEYNPPNPTTPGAGGNPNEPQKLTEQQIKDSLANKPFALFGDIDCETLKKWKAIAKFKPDQFIIDALGSLTASASNRDFYIKKSAYIQKLDDANSSVVNMDYFSVTVTQLPMINGQRLGPGQFLNYIRKNLNSFTNGDKTFAPYNAYGINDTDKWNSTDPKGAVIAIDMPGPDNGSVITSYSSTDKWTFTTIHEPMYGDHPVSGNRDFGYITNDNGSYTFYIRGVDRLTSWDVNAAQVAPEYFKEGTGIPFSQADALWTSFQNGIGNFVQTHGGSATVNSKQTYRPNWDLINDWINGKIKTSVLNKDCID